MTDSLTVLAVPGIGLWPPLFKPTVDHLKKVASVPVRVEVVSRPTDRLGFAEQVDALAARCRRTKNPVIVGVGGGATLALACAMGGADSLRGIVTHEPLLGLLEPSLHRRMEAAGLRLATERTAQAAVDFVAEQYGCGWSDAPPETELWARDHFEVICTEASQFASFNPDPRRLRLKVPHLTTVGASSIPERHRVRTLLWAWGATTETIQGSGHLVLADQPARFASTIADFLPQLSASYALQD